MNENGEMKDCPGCGSPRDIESDFADADTGNRSYLCGSFQYASGGLREGESCLRIQRNNLRAALFRLRNEIQQRGSLVQPVDLADLLKVATEICDRHSGKETKE